MVSEVMSFECSDSLKIGTTRESLQKAQANSISLVPEKYWSFQSIACIDQNVEQDCERKSGGGEAAKKGLEKNS